MHALCHGHSRGCTQTHAACRTFCRKNDVSAYLLLKACLHVRRNWDLTAIALTIYTLLVLPFRAAFYWEYYQDLEMHHSIIEQLEVSRWPQNHMQSTRMCLRLFSFYTISAATWQQWRWLQVDWMLLIELLIDFFFLADIALNCNTGYIAEQVCQAHPHDHYNPPQDCYLDFDALPW